MNTLHRIGFVAATGILLSGCSLFHGHESSALHSNQHAESATAQTIAEVQLEVGRENLGKGNLATATRYLLGARMHPATRADATNALGVVYVRLGRLDVAQRFFLEALEVEPDNARFATNVARLEGDLSFARMRAHETPTLVPSEVATVSLPVPEVQEQRRVPAAPRRQAHVIHIQTAEGPGQAPPQMEVYARRPVVQMVEREDTQGEQPVAPREVSRTKVIDYPVRVEI